jgi:hypothetical protein
MKKEGRKEQTVGNGRKLHAREVPGQTTSAPTKAREGHMKSLPTFVLASLLGVGLIFFGCSSVEPKQSSPANTQAAKATAPPVASTKTERGSQKGSKEPSPGEGKNNQAASQAGKPTPGASNTPQSGNEASTQQSSTQKSNSENTYHIVKNPIEFRIIEDVVKLAYTPHKEGGYNVMNEFFSFITKDASTFTREQLHDYIVKRSTEKNIVEKDESKGRVVYEYSSKELSNISPDSYLLQNFNSNFKFKLVAKEEEENFGYGV